MNYCGFIFLIWGFFVNIDIFYDLQKIDVQICMVWMDNYCVGLLYQQQLWMFNQFDSYDMVCFKFFFGKDVVCLLLVVVWLFSWLGVLCIYYGDEVGVDGNNDLFCCKLFLWDLVLQDIQLLVLYQWMVKLCKVYQVLCYGGCQVIYVEDNVVVFVCVYKQQWVLVVINCGEVCEVVIEDFLLLNVVGWMLQEGVGVFQDGVLIFLVIFVNVWFGC